MAQRDARKSGLGTFAGVFTPSVLTILGLILFRRLGYVVGSAGVGQALLILAIANAISLLTSSSLSAISTNLKVKGGGDYYLISRSLGVEFGGALGVALFLAQAISVAFYLVGFAEAIIVLVPAWPGVGVASLAAGAAFFLFVFAWLGSDWSTRLQYVVMAALAGSLVSFFAGGLERFSPATLAANWAPAAGCGGFWVLFALFFPAVTGFTQGVSMSGDLRDPGKSLPAGTFAAVGMSILVYLGAALVFGGALPAGDLTADYEAMSRVAWRPEWIAVGIVAATLSSALASFLGAPRILQALAADRVFPVLTPFAQGHGAGNNPRRGVLLTLAIALSFIAVGGIDFIAPIVSMFFLVSYGLLNYATAFEARSASPSFRPRFRWFHYRASLLGALACLAAMLMISPLASAVAIALLFALYQYVERIAALDRWADSRRDHHFQTVRSNLIAMAREPVHDRNWRPHLLVFSDQPGRRDLLVRFASWIEGGAGVTTVVRVVAGTGDTMRRAVEQEKKTLEADIRQRELDAFALVVAAPDIETGVQTLVQSYGIGPLRANTILLNWLEHAQGLAGGVDPETERTYVKHLSAAQRFGVNVIVLDAKEEAWQAVEPLPAEERRIDVWWFDDASSRLMLLLAYLMTRSDDWSGATLRLLVRSHSRARDDVRTRLEEALADFRIEAHVEVAANRQVFIEQSTHSSVVFAPLRFAQRRAVDPFGEPAEELLASLPVVALVSAGEDIALDAEPEVTGEQQLLALRETLAQAAAEVERLTATLQEAQATGRTVRAAVEGLRGAREDPGADPAAATRREDRAARLAEVEQQLAAADQAISDGERDLDRARKRAAAAQKDIEELGRARAAAAAADGAANPEQPDGAD